VSTLAELATRRPLALLGPGIAALAALVVIAVGAPDRLGVGSARIGQPAGPALVIIARGPFPARSRVFRVSLRTIVAGLESDAAVASARETASRGNLARVDVALAPADEAGRERAVERIEDEVDPGPLTLAYGGEARTLLDARHSLAGDPPKRELLLVPLAALVLLGVLGPAAAAGAAIAAVGAVAAALVALRVGAGLGGASLLGAAPAAVLGPVIAIELAALVRDLHREERLISSPTEALQRSLSESARLAAPLAIVAGLVPLALLVTPFPASGSLALGAAAAAAGALIFGAVSLPPLLAIEARGRPAPADAGADGTISEATRGALGRLAGSPVALVLVAVVAVAAPLALAAPAREAETRPLAAADLPRGSPALVAAREQAELAPPSRRHAVAAAPATDAVVARLPLAAAAVAVGLALFLLALTRSLRSLVAVPFALLPAAAALGAVTFVFADGHLAGALGLDRQGSLDTAAVACALAAVVAVSAGRSVRDCLAVRASTGLGSSPTGTAELAAGLVLPGIVLASLLVIAGGAILGTADLYPARELGLAVAAGMLVDLILRGPELALLARIGTVS
jgi:hypothetical protein